MPPQLALIIVLIIIICVIFIEHKVAENTSGAVWIIAIWILYSGSKGLGFFLNVQTTMEIGSLPDRYFLFSLGILSLSIILKRNLLFLSTFKENLLPFVILIYSLLSTLWSRDPGISFRRWGREAVALIIAMLLYSETHPIKTFTSAFKKSIYAALPLSILLIKYYPAYGRSYSRWSGQVMWDGIAYHKNGLAMICALSILFIIFSIENYFSTRSKLSSKLPLFIDILMAMLALYLLMGPKRTLTYSATSFLALIAGLICLIYFKAATKHRINITRKTMIAAILLIIIGILMPFSGKIPMKTLPKLLNRSETLTDRTLIWSALIPYAKKHIFIGYGFGGFWTTSLRDQIASHSHNGYLDTILDLGLIGLILFIIFILMLIQKNLRVLNSDNQIAYFFMSSIFVILVRNISEASLGEFTSYSTWLLLAWSFIINKKEDITFNKNKDEQFNQN